MEESYSVQSPSEGAFSSVTQSPRIQAQSKSRSLVQSTGRLKRDRATLSVDERGTKKLICNNCQSVIRAGGEEEETRNVKAQTETLIPNFKALTLKSGKEDLFGLLTRKNEELSVEARLLLTIAKEALKELFESK